MTTLSPSDMRQPDLGESSVDGSMADIFHPLRAAAAAAEQPSLPSKFEDVQQTLVNYIGQYPVVAIGLAVATGVMLGCLVKRR